MFSFPLPTHGYRLPVLRKASALAALVSILCGGLVFFLFRFLDSPFNASGESWLVLAIDESENEYQILSVLAQRGIEGFICESSQEVIVDNFGTYKMVKLESFSDEVGAFDPRDTGYAERLHSFFVRDGKRFFFLSLEKYSARKAEKLSKELGAALKDTSYTITFMGERKSHFRDYAILALVCACVFYFSRFKRLFVFQLPVLLAFGWAGFSGFIIAAILSAVWELLREPLGELSASKLYKRKLNYAGSGLKGTLDLLKPFRINGFLLLFFTVFLVLFFVFTDTPAIPLIAGILCFFVVYFLAFRAETECHKQGRHILFTPVPLSPNKARTFSFFPLLLPFTSGAILVLIFSLLSPASFLEGQPAADSRNLQNNRNIPDSENHDLMLADSRYLISSGEYYSNIDFQKSFSYMPLNAKSYTAGETVDQESRLKESYRQYYLGEDGLIGGSADFTASVPGNGAYLDFPPFPLEKLMVFLLNYSKPAAGNSAPGSIKEWIAVLMILSVCVLDLHRSGLQFIKRKKLPILRDKRIAA